MNEKNTGGPAFPHEEYGGKREYGPMSIKWIDEPVPAHPGMTLRDYFAGQALMEWSGTVVLAAGNERAQMKTIACICYGFADAMIEVRDE